MAQATKLEFGLCRLHKDGHDKKLIGCFQGDRGMINDLICLRKIDDDADPRKHWACVVANKDFVGGCAEIELQTAAPWGPQTLAIDRSG
jgi:hypothetical protein